MKIAKMHRRAFIGAISKAALGTSAAPLFCETRLFGREAANNKLNVACIGVGGQMHNLDLPALIKHEQNLVAICDVDRDRMALTRKLFSPALDKANVYKDYRELLEREKSLDAVVIATPDHWHALISTAAIQAGKHVYCEKPLAHTVAEARQVGVLAKHSKVATQTGNQGSATGNFRRSIELIQAGVFGHVHDIHMWHQPHASTCGIDRPPGADPVPEGYDWNTWVGPAPMRPYNQRYRDWRGWYDFGGGSISDFCCHAFSMPVRALKLNYPSRIEVSSDWLGKESFPVLGKVHYFFPPRWGRGPVAIHFHAGELPDSEVTEGMAETFNNIPPEGCLLLGDKGTLSAGLWNSECYLKMKGEPDYQPAVNHPAARGVPRSLPRAPKEDHMLEWLNACKGKGKTFSPFEFGGHVTEIGAAGLVALRLGRDIHWNGHAMQAKGEPAAAAFVKAQSRKWWEA